MLHLYLWFLATFSDVLKMFLYAKAAAIGLDYIHGRNGIHADVGAHKVIVSEDGLCYKPLR
jgi:hypothetical protein